MIVEFVRDTELEIKHLSLLTKRKIGHSTLLYEKALMFKILSQVCEEERGLICNQT